MIYGLNPFYIALALASIVMFAGISYWVIKTGRPTKILPTTFVFALISLTVGYFGAASAAKAETDRYLKSNVELAAILGQQVASNGHARIRLDGSTQALRAKLQADYENWSKTQGKLVGVQSVRKTPAGLLQPITEFGTSEHVEAFLMTSSAFAQTWNGSSQIVQLPLSPSVSIAATPILSPNQTGNPEAILLLTFKDPNRQAAQFKAQAGVIALTAVLLLLTLFGGVTGMQLSHTLAEARIAKAELSAQGDKIREQMDLIAEKNQLMALSKDALEQANSKLQALATTDGLTGVMNHRALMEFLSVNMKRNAVIGSPSSVILMDVDNFKQLNDQYGHIAGDEALRAIGEVLRLSCPSGAAVGRYGGEEFMMVLPGGSESAATAVAEELRRRIQMAKTTSRQVTASVGVSTVYSLSKSEQSLIDEADKALYQAKSAGKNCVRHFGHGMLESA